MVRDSSRKLPNLSGRAVSLKYRREYFQKSPMNCKKYGKRNIPCEKTRLIF
jgi:hypothetical protein